MAAAVLVKFDSDRMCYCFIIKCLSFTVQPNVRISHVSDNSYVRGISSLSSPYVGYLLYNSIYSV